MKASLLFLGCSNRSSKTTAVAAALFLVTGCPGDDPDPDPEPEGEWALTHEVDEAGGSLLSVWGPTPDDVRAVGGQTPGVGEAGTGLMLKRDGEAWVAETLPADTPVLNWIHGADGVTWAVGNAGAAVRLEGGAWVRDDSPVDVPLWGVFAISASEAWAVGGDAFDTQGTGVLVHYTGGAWTQVDTPMLDRPAPALFKVWASSATDVHAVGDNGVILHYDGATWTQVPSGITEDLISLWGTGPDEIVAVGGRSNGVLARYDGSAWSGTMLARMPALNGVWVDSEGDAIIAGERGVVARVPAGDDEAEILESPALLDVLHAAFGFDGGGQIAVGGSLQNSPPYTGLILERP
ncbi:MAG: hypothetical protein AAF721_34285 [Myxococcota bacterium]